MAGPAKETYIPDKDGATHGLASMAARSNVMGEQIAHISDRIRGLEAARPWGHAEEFGGHFNEVYTAGGGGGAEFVRQQSVKLAGETTNGLTTAHQALSNSVQLDQDGATLFGAQAGDAQQLGHIDDGRRAATAPPKSE